MPVQSLGQSIPPGGVTAQQPVQPTGTQTPADVQAIIESLTPIQARFRQQSSFLRIALPQASFTTPGLGVDVPANISNVGLAIRLITEWNIVLQVVNTATSAQTFQVSKLFPWNLIASTVIQINGGAAIYAASGPADYSVMTRQRRGSRKLTTAQSGWAAAFGLSVDPALLQVNTLGSNLTATNGSALTPSMSGIISISMAGSSVAGATSQWTLRFITIERVVQDRDSLLGVPPLQNNATFVQVTRRLVGALAGTRNDFSMPFYTAGANLTASMITATADTTYEFASVPSDPTLYAALVSNSFQTQEQRGFVVSSTGAEAMNYPIPTNCYLIALHNILTDTNGAGLPAFDSTNGLGLLKLVYAGASVIPVRDFPYRERAMAYLDYDFDPLTMPFTRIWDGERTSDDIVSSDNMGWLDCYATASPTELIDVGTSASTALTANITREVVITGNVQQLGG